jgi:hypothetical protein
MPRALLEDLDKNLDQQQQTAPSPVPPPTPPVVFPLKAPISANAPYSHRCKLPGDGPDRPRSRGTDCAARDGQLHHYIQVSFDWSGEHLHRFHIHGKDYGIAYLGGISFDDNPHAVPLSRFRLHPRESFRYEYDFIANW